MKANMTKEEYLKALRSCIQSLTVDEQEEALQYYSDYFDEAGDDAKVIEELGDPEEVAKGIVERLSNALSKTEKAKAQGEEAAAGTDVFDALFYTFENVKRAECSLGAAEVVLTKGNKFSVETRGISRENLYCHLSENGTLYLNNIRRLNLGLFSHERKVRLVPRILITVPENYVFERLKLTVGAGSFITKNASFSYSEALFTVEAGNLVLSGVDGRNTRLRCGMGNLKLEGSLKDITEIDCGMGSINLDLKEDALSCSYDVKVGLGAVKFNEEKRSGVCQQYASSRKPNHFSINCGMGSVIVNTKK